MHHALLTSPIFGAERRVIYKEDLEEFPVLPWSHLTEKQREHVSMLSKRLLDDDLAVFPEIDDFFAKLYRLSRQDMEVICDTLSVELPYGTVRARACLPPSEKQKEREKFRARLETTLRPFFKRLGKEVTVVIETPANTVLTTPYSTLIIRGESELDFELDPKIPAEVLEIANKTGASMIFKEVPGALAVGVLNQYRYWTPSRARLCAATSLREHMALFER